MSKKTLADTNNFLKDCQFNVNNNISTVNNFHKTKYEDIKNSTNKEDKMNYNNYKINNIYPLNNENKYIDIKKNLISTAINNMNHRNNINIYNSPKLNHKQNKSNHFNKTYKNNNNYGFINKNNIYIKYSNEQQNDKTNLLSDRSKRESNNEKNEYNKEFFKLDSYNEGLNDYNDYQNSGSAKSDDDDGEPDPRINFEQINQINKSRPLTSYGGLNARRKNLQSALQKNRLNRPVTSYNINNY